MTGRDTVEVSHSSSLSLAFPPALEAPGLLNSRCSPAWLGTCLHRLSLRKENLQLLNRDGACNSQGRGAEPVPRRHTGHLCVCSHSKAVGIGSFLQTCLQFLRRSLFTLERTLVLSHSACVSTSPGLQSGLLPSQTPSAPPPCTSFPSPSHTTPGAAREFLYTVHVPSW